MKNRAFAALCRITGIPQDLMVPTRVKIQDSLSSRLESASQTIFIFENRTTFEKYVVKVKGENYCADLEKIINHPSLNISIHEFIKGCILYQAKYTHSRESTIYTLNDDFLQKYTPQYLGAVNESGNVFLIMRFIEPVVDLSLEDKTNQALSFLAKLHSHFFKRYDKLDSIGLNILRPQLFNENINMIWSIYQKAIDMVVLPQQLLYDLSNYINKVDKEFKVMQDSGLTFCHCDFAFRNILFELHSPIVIDWELSTALEPQFDLIEFMVDYPTPLIPLTIKNIINIYIDNAYYSIDYREFQIALLRNLYHYFCFRLASLILISQKTPISWLNSSIQNYVSIWKCLQQNINEHL